MPKAYKLSTKSKEIYFVCLFLCCSWYLWIGMCFLPLYPYKIQNVLFYSPKTWYEAQSYCREKCIDLLTFDNMKQIETIVNFLENKYNDAVWFGLWKGKTQRWHWSMPSNDFYNYLPWGSNTNYNCGTYENRSLSSDPCHHAKNFICFDGKRYAKSNSTEAV
uniref:C-type lectin domain-containing protein n=1 Tax=Pundamilia nyererei TaxID=303518 RepID=A0A3B4G7Y3_9CICH